jgi:hypothetical protein
MLVQLLACPNCGAPCDPADGVACRACGAYVRDAPSAPPAAPAPPSATEPAPEPEPAPPAAPARRRRRRRDDLLPGALARRRRGRRYAVAITVLAVGVNMLVWWRLGADAGPRIVDDATSTPAGGAEIGTAEEADRPAGRPPSGAAERTLVEVWAPIADLYAMWDDYSRVTPAALGAAQPHIGIVGPDRSPTRIDEVSLLVDHDVFVVLGTRDGGACAWLRDNGAGPQAAQVANALDCSANAAPIVGWDDLAP